MLGGDAETIAERSRPVLAGGLGLAHAPWPRRCGALAGPDRTLGGERPRGGRAVAPERPAAFRRIETASWPSCSVVPRRAAAAGPGARPTSREPPGPDA